MELAFEEQKAALQVEITRRASQILTLQEADAARQEAWERERAVSRTLVCGSVYRT